MKFRILFYISLSLLILAVSSCKKEVEDFNTEPENDVFHIEILQNPASPGSGEVNLFSTKLGEVVLSWVEQSEDNSELKFARMEGSSWSEPSVIAAGNNWFVNWADFPSVIAHENGQMAAHYLAKNGEGTFAYGVNLVFAKDWGQSWSNPTIPHETKTQTEHGFVTLLPYEEGYFATWLDGRNTGGGHGSEEDHDGHHGAMTLRAAFIDTEGSVKEEFELDDRTCDCCQTTAVITLNGPVVAYRDRSEEEIRDIALVRWDGEGWTSPEIPNPDHWLIPGCPVNGPVLATNGQDVAMAWFTSPDEHSMMKLAFSRDMARNFSKPVRIDLGNAIGRIDMVMVEDGSVYLTWMEATGEQGQLILAHYNKEGQLINQSTIAENRSDRASGFPRMARTEDFLFIAWRDINTEPGIKTIRVKI
jgi:hypothetical protein